RPGQVLVLADPAVRLGVGAAHLDRVRVTVGPAVEEPHLERRPVPDGGAGRAGRAARAHGRERRGERRRDRPCSSSHDAPARSAPAPPGSPWTPWHAAHGRVTRTQTTSAPAGRPADALVASLARLRRGG